MRSFLIAVPLLAFAACSSSPKARLVEWKNDELTVCCGAKNCGEKEWNKVAAQHCAGPVVMVGGENRERLAGYRTQPGKKGSVTLDPMTTEEACRIFKCQGAVVSEKK